MPGAAARTTGSFAGTPFPAISFFAGISFDGGSGFGSPETPSATLTANTDAARQAAPADHREPIPTDRASADTATEGRTTPSTAARVNVGDKSASTGSATAANNPAESVTPRR